jgi:hypothetical protein
MLLNLVLSTDVRARRKQPCLPLHLVFLKMNHLHNRHTIEIVYYDLYETYPQTFLDNPHMEYAAQPRTHPVWDTLKTHAVKVVLFHSISFYKFIITVKIINFYLSK